MSSPPHRSRGGHPRHGSGRRPLSGLARLGRAWRTLGREQRLAAVAALGLFISMLLPWYGETIVTTPSGAVHPHDLSAFDSFSFVEAAVLLVAAGVLVLLFARAEGKAFHLPGGDGPVIMAFGVWAGILIFYRLLDTPHTTHSGPTVITDVGLKWGIFIALVAAGALAVAGYRVRAAHRPEPPLLLDHGAPPPPTGPGSGLPERSPRPGSIPTPPLPPSGPATAVTERLEDRGPSAGGRSTDRARERPQSREAPDQLSLDVPLDEQPDERVRRADRRP